MIIFLSISLTCVWGAQKNSVIETVLKRTQSICFAWEISNFTSRLSLFMLGNFSCFLIFFSKNYFKNTKCAMVWIQIETDILSVLIWVQTVCVQVISRLPKPPLTDKEIIYRENHNVLSCIKTEQDKKRQQRNKWHSYTQTDKKS